MLQVVDGDRSRAGSPVAGRQPDPFDVQKEAVVGSLFRLLLATAGAANVRDVSARSAALQGNDPNPDVPARLDKLQGDAARSGGPPGAQELSEDAAALAEEAAARAEADAAVTVGFIPLAGAAAAAAQLAQAALQPRTSSSCPGARADCPNLCADGRYEVDSCNGPEPPGFRPGLWVAGAARRLGAALPRVTDRVLFALADALPGADCVILAAKRWLSGLQAEQRAWMGPLQCVLVDELEVPLEQWVRQPGPGQGPSRLAASGAPAAAQCATLEDAEGLAGALDAAQSDIEVNAGCLATGVVPDVGVAPGAAAECPAA